MSSEAPRVSIVIPAFNAEGTIGRALDSTRLQVAPIETIVIDDGSRDRTVEIAQQYPGVRIVRHDTNRGVAAALLTGFRAARGEYVLRLDADDTLPHRAVVALLDRAVATDADIVVGMHRRIHPSGRRQTVAPQRTTDLNRMKITVDNFALWGKLIRRDILLHALPRPGLDLWEDLSVIARLYARLPRVEFISEPVYNYYIAPHGHSLSTSSRERILHDHIEIARCLDRELPPRYKPFLDYLKFCAKVKYLRHRPRMPRRWLQTFPEVNSRIMSFRHVALRHRLAFRLVALFWR